MYANLRLAYETFKDFIEKNAKSGRATQAGHKLDGWARSERETSLLGSTLESLHLSILRQEKRWSWNRARTAALGRKPKKRLAARTALTLDVTVFRMIAPFVLWSLLMITIAKPCGLKSILPCLPNVWFEYWKIWWSGELPQNRSAWITVRSWSQNDWKIGCKKGGWTASHPAWQACAIVLMSFEKMLTLRAHTFVPICLRFSLFFLPQNGGGFFNRFFLLMVRGAAKS